MTDRTRAAPRGAKPAKPSTKHPYAAIEHRVIDSSAYADLSFSAQALLMLMARQLTKDNNGHLQATFAFCKHYGFGSEHTLRAAIAELVGHGFIYKTRSHGANGAWARYAVTWKPIKKPEGLFLSGFVPCAWREWVPDVKKTTRQKLLDQSGRKCSFTPEHPAETAGKPTAETADYELCTSSSAVAGASAAAAAWVAGYLKGLAASGLAGRQCFQIPHTGRRQPAEKGTTP